MTLELHKTLSIGVVRSMAANESTLFNNFLAWAENMADVTPLEALALFFEDDRARFLRSFGTIERKKELVRTAKRKIGGLTPPYFLNEPYFVVNFSPPDDYGEIHEGLEGVHLLEWKKGKGDGYVSLYLFPDIKPVRYFMSWNDAGTVNYARARGDMAVSGRLVDVDMDWKKMDGKYPIINFIGTASNGIASLHLFTSKKQLQTT